MDPSNPEIALEVPPYLRIYKNGTIERIAGIETVPAGIDSETNVVSRDILIIPETGVTARLYYPNSASGTTAKLPLVLYLHGGAFCISSPADPLYHNSVNRIVAEANVVAVSVNYRLAPEHALPAAFEDSWDALKWVAYHASEDGENGEGEVFEKFLRDRVDFNRVFLAGDSAGANMGHHMALKLNSLNSDSSFNFRIPGLIMINPYFWGKEPIGVEITDTGRKKMVDLWWSFLCPSDKGSDDPLINPFVEEAPGFEGVGCSKVLVIVAENDILKERGKLYHKTLVNSGWKGEAEFHEIQGEDHVFHIFNPDCDNAKSLFKRIAAFINDV